MNLRLVLTAALLAVVPLTPAFADQDLPPCVAFDVTVGGAGCHMTSEQLFQQVQHAAGTAIRYRVDAMCVEMQDQPVCVNPVRCSAPPDTFKYHVFRSADAGVTWSDVGTVCLGAGQADTLQVITVDRIVREFRRIEWGSAELVIQPPDGKTLVNLATNFFTTTTEPRVQPLSLFGHTVDIEASPASYAWHFGDGDTQSGAAPGAAYPDLEITHSYTQAGVTVTPSVDVTYAGRWRIDGGAWRDIPETLTVPGTAVALQVLSATPHLVG
jgi:hypothetical protein